MGPCVTIPYMSNSLFGEEWLFWSETGETISERQFSRSFDHLCLCK